jgi:hypothetical protein
MLNNLLLGSMVILLISCSVNRKNGSQNDMAKPDKLNVGKEVSETKILFLTLSMTQIDSASETYKFSLVNSVFAEGQLHKNSFKEPSLKPFYLYCEITDDDQKRTDFIAVRNPLLKVVEYSPEVGKLDKKVFVSKTGEVYLRFQFTKTSKYLTIYKPQPDLRTLKKIYHAQI